MKRLFTLIAVALMGINTINAQSFTLTIEGKEVKNGDNIEVTKTLEDITTKQGPLTFTKIGVQAELTSTVNQKIDIEAADLDQTSPGISCCPPGFTCSNANAANNWKSTGGANAEAGKKYEGHWIDWNYGTKSVSVGTERKANITFKAGSETVAFHLTVKVGDGTNINEIIADENENAVKYNVAGQIVNGNYKGIIVKKGMKYSSK